MTNSKRGCPVCETQAALQFSDPERRETSVVLCQECGEFLIEDTFLTQEWSMVPEESRRAVAAYLKATKELRNPLLEIAADIWEVFARRGLKLLKPQSETARPQGR